MSMVFEAHLRCDVCNKPLMKNKGRHIRRGEPKVVRDHARKAGWYLDAKKARCPNHWP